MTNRAHDWLAQATEDFAWARNTKESGHFSQACFICQQIGEKAMKAIALAEGFVTVRGHSILEICRALGINDEIEHAAKRLDQYYISARYPVAFPSGAPFEYFTAEQAEEALVLAGRILAAARDRIGNADPT